MSEQVGRPESMVEAQVVEEAREPRGEPAPVPEPADVEVPTALRREIEGAMKRYPEKRSASIPALWAVQRQYGWCTPEGIRQAAAVMGVTPAYLEAVASFYDLFHLEPHGEHEVLVCTNISCWLRGGDELLDAFVAAAAPGSEPGEAAPSAGAERGVTSPDRKVHVRGFECLGACDIAPMASVDGVYVGPVDLDEVPEMVEQLRAGQPVLPAKQIAIRPTVDPNAGMPGPPVSAGDIMPGDQPGPTAPLEQAPDPPEGPEPKS